MEDIVAYLVSTHGLQLVRTLDGHSYLTTERLEEEIAELLNENGGRLALEDLASLLGLGSDVIEPFVNRYCFKTRAEVVMGLLVTQPYLSQIVDEVADFVEAKGRVSVQELNEHY